MLFLTGCNYDPYSGQRPCEYDHTKWSCEDINAWFVVDNDIENYTDPEGEIIINGKTYPIKVYFIGGTNRIFLNVYNSRISPENKLGEIYAGCTFSETHMTININVTEYDRDTLFNGRYKTLTFKREDL